jgi:hypothetical protein
LQVGTGSRGQLYLRGVVDRITGPDSPNKVVAFCDKNIGRVQYYNKLLQELGQPVSCRGYDWDGVGYKSV